MIQIEKHPFYVQKEIFLSVANLTFDRMNGENKRSVELLPANSKGALSQHLGGRESLCLTQSESMFSGNRLKWCRGNPQCLRNHINRQAKIGLQLQLYFRSRYQA